MPDQEEEQIKFETRVDKTPLKNTLVFDFVGTDHKMECNFETSGKWTSNMYMNVGGNFILVGSNLAYSAPLWEPHRLRDIEIKKRFSMAGILEDSAAKKKGQLLEAMVASITEEHKTDVTIRKSEADVMPKNFVYVPDVTYSIYRNKFKQYFYMGDEAPLIHTLSTMLSHYIPEGDPVWLYIVGPPSSGKTEGLRTVTPGGKPNMLAYPLSNVTGRTFISGKEGVEDLITRINGKLLIIKDLTTLLSKSPEERAAIFAQMREIYDGYLNSEYGSGIVKGYEVDITIIGGVTHAIYSPKNRDSILGERFTTIQMYTNIEFRHEIGSAAANHNRELEESIRIDLSNYALSMMMDFKKNARDHKPDVQVHNEHHFVNFATITSILRTDVERDFKGNTVSMPVPECSPRLIGTFKKQATAISWLLGKDTIDNEVLSLIYRLAIDSVDPTRISVLKKLSWEPQTIPEIMAHDTTQEQEELKALKTDSPVKNIDNQLKISKYVVGQVLEEFWMLGIINRTFEEEEGDEESQKADEKDGKPKPSKTKMMWSLNKDSDVVKGIWVSEMLLKNLPVGDDDRGIKNQFHHIPIGFGMPPTDKKHTDHHTAAEEAKEKREAEGNY